ncbi:MAG: hypothetical protein Q8P25_04900 [Candidatus Curtissbacteria bacterium]|nr:hypothetical protein [Candidatus Curtissbacteria bacterium]
MKIWNGSFLTIFALLFLSVPATFDLTTPGFYTSHDGETHTARIAQYFQSLGDGQLPPRIAPTLYNGYGSPIFTYIYPLPYVLGSFVHFLHFSYTDSFKILMISGFITSGLFSRLWFKEVFGSEKAAFIGALYYTWVPYRLQLMYVRGSISELLAYTFLPLTFFCFGKLSKEGSIFWISTSAVSLSLVLLSQNLVALMTLPILAVYVLIIAKKRSSLIKSTASIIWAFMIAAVTYLPSLFERNFVRFDEIINIAYSTHFVTLSQLFHSPWGYGFDFPGTLGDQLSFQIGLAHIIVVIFATFLIIKKLLKRFVVDLPLFFLIVFLVSVFLMLDTKPNSYIWQHFKILHTIDIPWRFLGVTAISSSFLAAFVVKTQKSSAVFLLLALFVIVANRNHLRINEPVERTDQFFEQYQGTATQYNEFTPIWRQTTSPPEISSEKTHVLNGDAKVTNFKSDSKSIKFDANVQSQTAQIRIDKYYFPNTKTNLGEISFSDTKTKILEGEKDGSGLIIISLPSGFHQVSIKYQETRLRMFANYLTTISLSLALFLILKNVKRA